MLTTLGEIYTMGSNSRGQLGTGSQPNRGQVNPVLLEELTFTKFIKIRAGGFSAALALD